MPFKGQGLFSTETLELRFPGRVGGNFAKVKKMLFFDMATYCFRKKWNTIFKEFCNFVSYFENFI